MINNVINMYSETVILLHKDGYAGFFYAKTWSYRQIINMLEELKRSLRRKNFLSKFFYSFMRI